MTFKEFCEKHGVTVSCQYIDTRPDNNDDWAKTATHYSYSLSVNPSIADKCYESKSTPIHQGYYSKGSAHAEGWAKKNYARAAFGYNTRDALRNPLPAGRKWRDDSSYVQDIRKIAGPKVAPKACEVLESLVMDSRDSDQPFEDWAPDLGYSDDSISAKKIWEACNDTKRALERAFTPEQKNELIDAMVKIGALAKLESK